MRQRAGHSSGADNFRNARRRACVKASEAAAQRSPSRANGGALELVRYRGIRLLLLPEDVKEYFRKYDAGASILLERKQIVIPRCEILRICCCSTGDDFVVIWIARHGSRRRWGIDDDRGYCEKAVAKLCRHGRGIAVALLRTLAASECRERFGDDFGGEKELKRFLPGQDGGVRGKLLRDCRG